MHKYLPHTSDDIKVMLKAIGLDNLEALYSNLPKKLIIKDDYKIPGALSEIELVSHINALASKNKQLTVFRGYGAYDHASLAVVNALCMREEFLTSYTPYQPEVAQGTLQYIFEYQSMICDITGMDVSNASMYDGATATAEAMFMALAANQKKKVLISSTVFPEVIDVVKTYGKYRDVKFVILKEENGITDLSNLDELLDESAALILQNPNRYGIIENYNDVSTLTKKHNTTFILNVNPNSLSVLKTPGEYGADIACGEAQSLGIPLSFGGPYLGFLAAKNSYLRKMPGRICGVTNDLDGKRAFVLTLQAREQHIRRAKANSNICSNQSLMALSAVVYLASLGKKGFAEVGRLALNKAHYLYNKLLETKMFDPVYQQPFYNEFLLKAKFDSKKWLNKLLKHNILGPLPLDNDKLLFAVTEKQSKDEIDLLVSLVGEPK